MELIHHILNALFPEPGCHRFGPTWEERIEHIKKWEEEYRKKERWKKKFDWRCPGCGGMMMNRGGGIYKDSEDSFLMECLACHTRYISGDYEIKQADISNIAYEKYLKEVEDIRNKLHFYDVETKIRKKWMEPVQGDVAIGYIVLQDGREFCISWCTLEELNYSTGNLNTSIPDQCDKYNAIVKKAFDAIELDKTYVVTVHTGNDLPPYVSAIKGLVLEENLIGEDHRSQEVNR